MKEFHLSTLLQLRLIVGFLGERTQFAWWPTAFYESSSRLFLEPVFTKTSQLAQYHGVLEAARKLHDEHLSVGNYHLFRLPEEVEQDLHAMMQSSVDKDFSIQSPKSKEVALNSLKNLSGMSVPVSTGPINVGNIKELDSDDVLKSIARTYLSAFSQNAKTYPYLMN